MKALSQSERSDIYRILISRKESKLTALTAEDPGWRQRIEERKNKLAMGRLRVEKEAIELKKIEDAIRVLDNQRSALELRIAKKMPLKKRDRYEDACPMPKSLCEAVSAICEEIHESEMAKDPAGKKAIAIQAEFDSANAQLALCSTREDVAARNII